jgi:aspartate/glutamate racemase
LVTPVPEAQEELVAGAILQVKLEHTVDEPRKKLMEAVATMDPEPVALVAGCTEVELAFAGADGSLPVVRPMELLAQEIVDRAWRG